MKIAFFTDSYYPMINGVTVSVSHYANELRELGHTVYIFAPKFDGYQENEKDVYRLSAVKILSTEFEIHMPLMMPHRILKEINPRDFDIVHAHGNGFFSFLGYQMALIKGVPFVMTFHTQMTRYTHYVLNGKLITPGMAATGLKLFGNVCHAVIAPSEKMKEELISYGVSKPITVIPNFVYLDKFATNKKGFLRKQFSIPPHSPILLSVGRLGKEKNFPFILKVFKTIMKKNKSAHLVIVGYGDEFESLKGLAEKLKLGDRVHFTGKVLPDEIDQVYSDADIYLFASKTETQGIVVLEAAASGLPFVVVRDEAYRGMIINNENGYQVNLNISDFAEKVLELLSNQEKREQFGRKSREIARNNFNPRLLAEHVLELYDDLLLRQKPRRISLHRLNTSALNRLYRTAQVLDRIFE